ncbi:SNF2 family N-terminal domain-containing protein [Diplogelasinospora grovesii]|uniref:SNF2 family N-terminal domain-containing protein n=1 Tax=Diplogelasinospora grovesii TaxID=303347 RepID=A0AAN6NIK3_9PEZI|nr:SNF2 family N-terminal domain-containing protein [Diplogelasinospora grovesii]
MAAAEPHNSDQITNSSDDPVTIAVTDLPNVHPILCGSAVTLTSDERTTNQPSKDCSGAIPSTTVAACTTSSSNSPNTTINDLSANGITFPSELVDATVTHTTSSFSCDTGDNNIESGGPTDDVVVNADNSAPFTGARLIPKSSTALPRAKCARDYWKLVYQQLRLQGDTAQHDGKRKADDSDDDPQRIKRQKMLAITGLADLNEKHNVTSDPLGRAGAIAARAELGDITPQREISGDLKRHEQLALLKRDIDPKNQQAKDDHGLLWEATVSFGHGRCKAENGKWKLPGLTTTLYHHQLIGVRWMLGREFHPDGPNGGILADEMGLGKTVQMLACISENMPAKKAKAWQTLIVAPNQLTHQWLSEVRKHCEEKYLRRVYIYSASRNELPEQWEDCGVIITNYHQIAAQFPSAEVMEEIEDMKSAGEGEARWRKEFEKRSGELFRHPWHRIVLDEAHAINNRSSQTSRACRYLLGKYRWVLTGTPMTNNIDEFFPYLHFLGTRYKQFSQYQSVLGSVTNIPKDENMENLRAVYQTISLRRRVEDKFMGKPILQIPKTHPTQVIRVDLSPQEKEFQENIKQARKHVQQLDKYDKHDKLSGEAVRLFLQQRLLCSHFELIDQEHRRTQSKARDHGDPNPENVVPSPRHFFCGICAKVLLDGQVSDCKHAAFCRKCVTKDRKFKRECPSCKSLITRTHSGGDACFQSSIPQYPGGLSASRRRGKGKGTGKGKGRGNSYEPWRRGPGDDGNGFQPKLDGQGKIRTDKTKKRKARGSKKAQKGTSGAHEKVPKQLHANAGKFLHKCDKAPWEPIPHSAKTKKTLELICEWQREAPDDKIIVFVQWIPMLCILGRMLFQNGIDFVYLCGDMDLVQRHATLQAFQDRPDIKLASVTSGAQGLNLTAANRAIVFDLWWNNCQEQQAFGRIHRIGQTKEVYTAKLIASDTIDEEVLDLQDNKEASIAAATHANGKGIKRTQQELRELLKDEATGDSQLDEVTEDEDEDTEGEQDDDPDYVD